MKLIWQKTMSLIGLIFVLVYGSVCEGRDAFAEDPSSSNPQAAVFASAAKQCPTNLSSLQPKMEKALQFVKSTSFRDAMLASLQPSIPEAIAQSDGLTRQITFLKQAIVSQERERAHAEKWREKVSLIPHNRSSLDVIEEKRCIAMQWINT